MHPVSHFVLCIRFRTSGVTLRPHILNHHIKLVGISSFADPSGATICYIQTKNRYSSSYIRKWLTRGCRQSPQGPSGFFYNSLVENHEEHIAAILLIDACGSKRFSDHRLATSHLPCIGHWRMDRPTYLDLLMQAAEAQSDN